MTPQEKAKELVNSFESIEWCQNFSIGDGGWETQETQMTTVAAKKCAVIAVNEIMKYTPFNDSQFWMDVKTEIEKL